MGAAHSFIFAVFPSQAIADRVTDADSRIIITADGGHRRGSIVPLKTNVDDAIKKLQDEDATKTLIRKGIVLKHTKQDVPMSAGRGLWWSDAVAHQSTDCPAE